MSKKLLLADDSATIQRVIEMTFAGEDVQVLTVGDGEEAIARISAEKPDIVLADIGMPKRSGYEVSAFVKGHAELSKTPVLLLAGAFEPVDDAKAKEAKCDGVLVKPFEPQHVIARVRELLGGATGSPTQAAVSDILRPAAALTPPRPVELPKPEEKPSIPEDLIDIGADDLMPPIEEMSMDDMPIEAETTAVQPLVMDDSLDDYFDKLDEAFATINTSAPPAPPPHADAIQTRPDRPVLERDLKSFDQPLTVETSVHIEPAGMSADPFAGIDSLQPDEAAVPTLDDLLAGMTPTPSGPEISFDDLVEPQAPQVSTFIPSEPLTEVSPSGIGDQGSRIGESLPNHPTPDPGSLIPEPIPEPRSPIPDPGSPIPEGTTAPSGRSIIADAFSALLAAEQGEGAGTAPLRLPGNGSAPVVTDAMVDDVARRVIQRLALGTSEQMQAIVRNIVSGVAERLVREEIDRIRRNAGSS
jgi:CheY-like chemotaxis protein